MTLSPAYGRDYKSREAVLEAWNSNKDFMVESPPNAGRYTSKKECQKLKVRAVTLRYDKKQKSVYLQLSKPSEEEE